jgi:hypothetical protein
MTVLQFGVIRAFDSSSRYTVGSMFEDIKNTSALSCATMRAGYGCAYEDAEEETDGLRESHSTTRLQDWSEDRAAMAHDR